jgi:hypothetical protein
VSEEKPTEKPEKKSESITYAIILLAIVIAVLGTPFFLNEYEKWQYNENLKKAYSQAIAANQPNIVQKTITRVVTPIPTPAPTPIPTIQRKITDGFWCRDTTINIGKAPTNVRECYQFLSDGTFKWGYSPGYPMGKSPSCWSPNVKCEYSLNANGKYEVQGGYFYTLSGDTLIDPHNPPYFKWSSTGIP